MIEGLCVPLTTLGPVSADLTLQGVSVPTSRAKPRVALLVFPLKSVLQAMSGFLSIQSRLFLSASLTCAVLPFLGSNQKTWALPQQTCVTARMTFLTLGKLAVTEKLEGKAWWGSRVNSLPIVFKV